MGGVLRHAVVVVVVLLPLPLPLLTTAVSARSASWSASHRLDCFSCNFVPIFSFISFGDKNCIQCPSLGPVPSSSIPRGDPISLSGNKHE